LALVWDNPLCSGQLMCGGKLSSKRLLLIRRHQARKQRRPQNLCSPCRRANSVGLATRSHLHLLVKVLLFPVLDVAESWDGSAGSLTMNN
jgi:hypothetical protein